MQGEEYTNENKKEEDEEEENIKQNDKEQTKYARNYNLNLRAGSDEQYERWVKTLVVELMRQTPLESVRFLDILGITATIVSARDHSRYEDERANLRRGMSESNLSSSDDFSSREDFDQSLRSSPENSLMSEDCFLQRGRPKERVLRTCMKNVKSDENFLNSYRNYPENSVVSDGFLVQRGRAKERVQRTCLKNNGSTGSEEDCEMSEEAVSELGEMKRGRAKERQFRVRVEGCARTNGFEDREKRQVRAQSSDPVRKMSDSDSERDDVDDKEVAALLLRCQQVDNYVPVKEKRRLFESLCRRGRRLAQSTDNLSTVGVAEVKLRRKKRARSLHDLSRCTKSSVAVREICRYFEQRGQDPPKERSVEESPRHKPPTGERSVGGCNAYLSRRRVQRAERRLARYKQQAADTEESIWRLQEEMASLDCKRNQTTSSNGRSKELRLYAALEMRLAEEESRLSRINEEASRTLREIELATDKFETALMQSSEELTTKNNGRQ
ncbi:hypothetical protein C0J52_19102 [Blattella germanica]|nr:hypothetical protein C0J52_19102 [Blattella germanica]